MNKFVAVAAGVAVAFGAVLVAPVSVYANDAANVAGVGGENVPASFTKQIGEHVQLRWDADKRTVTVTGHGVFDKEAWTESLSRGSNVSRVWQQVLRVEFVPDAGKQIAFPADSTNLFAYVKKAELVWPANGIDTSNVTNMYGMFAGATSANPDVSKWDTSKVTDMSAMFAYADSVNPDVSKWDTSKVTDMHAMFFGATSANPDVSKWDTSNVTNMHSMFFGATSANPDLCDWDMSKVEYKQISGENISKADYIKWMTAESAYVPKDCSQREKDKPAKDESAKDKPKKDEPKKDEPKKVEPEKGKSEKDKSEKDNSEKDRQLANTGAGGVVAPVAVAATLFAGAAASALGLRRRRDS